MPTAANANATSSAAGSASSAHGETSSPNPAITVRNPRVEPAADQRPADLAQRDVHRTQRRGQHRVVEPRVLELEEHVVRRVEHRAVHRRGGEQPGGDERRVADRRAVRAGQRSRPANPAPDPSPAGRTPARRSRRRRPARPRRDAVAERSSSARERARVAARRAASAARAPDRRAAPLIVAQAAGRRPAWPARCRRDQEQRPGSPGDRARAAATSGPARPTGPARCRATAGTPRPPAATQPGSRSTGKNVPENSVIGITTNRNRALNAAPSLVNVPEKAVISGRDRGAGEHGGHQRDHDPRAGHAAEQRRSPRHRSPRTRPA